MTSSLSEFDVFPPSIYAQIEQLQQLRKATFDGDLIGKYTTRFLESRGHVYRADGYSLITNAGEKRLRGLVVLRED